MKEKKKKKRVLAKYLLLFDPIWLSVFCVCISMTRAVSVRTKARVSLTRRPLIRRQQRRGALWDGSRVKDGANTDRLQVHTHRHKPATWDLPTVLAFERQKVFAHVSVSKNC